MFGRGTSIGSPHIVVVVEQQKALKASHSDAVMLMDVGHRLLCSLRQVDSRRRSPSSNPPSTLLFTAEYNTHSLVVGIPSRYSRHGSQRTVSDDKLVTLLGEILRFGAALSSWRSWDLGSERFSAVRCMSHRSMAFASTETRDVQDATKNDQLNASRPGEAHQALLESQECRERSLFVGFSKQLEHVEQSDVNALQQDRSMKEDSLNSKNVIDISPSDFSDESVSNTERLGDVVVIVFDIETTGFKLSDDRIIEFAARDLAGGDCSTMQTLVNPERPVPVHATNIHGIHSSMVNKSDVPRWKEVAPVLTQFVESRRISGGPVFLVAHNGKRFDVPFLMKEFERCSLQIPPWWQFVDSVPIAREAMKAKGGKGSLRLSALYEYYKLPYVGEAHRALADVDMLASVLQMLLVDLRMSFPEFLKKSFTIKDIMRSSAPNSDNLEPYSQDLELSSELSMETEDLGEVSCASHEAGKNPAIPWDDVQGEGRWGTSLLLGNTDIQQVFLRQSKPIANKEAWTNVITKNEMGLTEHNSSIANLDRNIGTSGRVGEECDASYHFMQLDEIDLSQLYTVLKKYLHTKFKRPHLLLLWRVGDFYQAFFDDAKKLSEVCNISVSAIQGGEFLDGLVPMASLHREHVDVYIQALLAEGVGVCKQNLAGKMSHDALSQEHVTGILTPGTGKIPVKPDKSSNSILLAVVPPDSEDGIWGLAYTDISTGEINAAEGQGQRSMMEEIFTLQPSEILCSYNADTETLHCPPPGLPSGFSYSLRPSLEFCSTYFEKKLQELSEFETLEHTGLRTLPVAACAVGGLLGFLEDTQWLSGVKLPFHKIVSYHPYDCMLLDQCTRTCLEVFKTKRQGQLKGSLLWAMDHTKTPMGKRLLKKWFSRPLLDNEMIRLRQDAVEVFVENPVLREQIRFNLCLVNDLERLVKRIVSDQQNPWNFLALGQSINILQALRVILEGQVNPFFSAFTCDTNLLDLGQKLQNYFETRASSILQGGQIIKRDVDEALDALRKEIQSMDEALKNFERLERDRTKNLSLELVQTEMGDYFISVKNQALTGIPFPDDYQLCSSVTFEDAVCFVTTTLIEHNKKRSELINKLRLKEASMLKCLRDEVYLFIKPLQIASQAVAAVDVLSTFAEVAVLRQYCKPAIVEDSREIKIVGGRHPVAELLKPERELFNANSLYMGYVPHMDKTARNMDLNKLGSFPLEEHGPSPDILILTGPPASGKSCYLQQAGLIQLLAQIGSFVPAKEAVLGIADAIFMKAEDTDDVSAGKSSFELDMDRYVYILRSATSKSLVLLDGIDRGLSLNDDGAVTRALVEYLAQNVKARTLLTTQNNNLGSLEEEFANINNFQCVNDVDSMFSYCVKPGFFFEPSIAALDKVDGLPEWISIRASQLISKDDSTGEEAYHLEQQLSASDVAREEFLQASRYLPNNDRREVQSFELEQELLESDAAAAEFQALKLYKKGDVQVEQECESSSKYSLSGTDLEQKIYSLHNACGTAATAPPLLLSFEGVLETTESHASDLGATAPPLSLSIEGVPKAVESLQGLQVQEVLKREDLIETWQSVLQTLQDYPATHALAKQKGILVSITRSLEVAEVHMTTSTLFLKKFLQPEHATTLENAFLTVLKSPVQLKLTVASE